MTKNQCHLCGELTCAHPHRFNKTQKNKQQNSKVNTMLSTGLYVISAKHRIGTSLFVLYITDFVVNTRVIFDAETLKVLPNKYGVEVADKDKEALVKVLGWEVKKVEVPVVPNVDERPVVFKTIVGVKNGVAVLDGDVKSFDEE